MQQWNIPENIYELVYADEDCVWEDESWDPVLLSVIGGTSYGGRDIPLSWQIEFEPFGEIFSKGNEQLNKLGEECDGYGWANLINTIFIKHHPDLKDHIYFGDTDSSACVVWTETESTCKKIMSIVNSLLGRANA